MTEKDLRAAMRDPRYWQAGHPERDGCVGWVTEGWAKVVPAQQASGDKRVTVQVRAYERTRYGRPEHVSGYQQSRAAGQDEPALQLVSSNDNAAAPSTATGAAMPPKVVIFVGGLADGTFRNVLDGEVNFRRLNPGIDTRYFQHDQDDELRAFIISQPAGSRVAVVGHSWGADTAAQVVAKLGTEGRPVETLVTIDPVRKFTGGSFFSRVRAGARNWVNVNAAGGSSFEQSNLIAGLGSPYDQRPREFTSGFIDAPFPHAEFWKMLNARSPKGQTAIDALMGRWPAPIKTR